MHDYLISDEYLKWQDPVNDPFTVFPITSLFPSVSLPSYHSVEGPPLVTSDPLTDSSIMYVLIGSFSLNVQELHPVGHFDIVHDVI